MSAPLRRERAIRASAVIGALSELWPGTFAVHGRHRRALVLGIHSALLSALELAIRDTVKDIKAALGRYVSAEGYLRVCRRAGTARTDLTGNLAGAVTPAEAKRCLPLSRGSTASPIAEKRRPIEESRMGAAGKTRGPGPAGCTHRARRLPRPQSRCRAPTHAVAARDGTTTVGFITGHNGEHFYAGRLLGPALREPRRRARLPATCRCMTGVRHDGLKPPAPTRGAWRYVYDGRVLVAVIEQRNSRWHVIRNDKDVADFSTREDALASLRGAA